MLPFPYPFNEFFIFVATFFLVYIILIDHHVPKKLKVFIIAVIVTLAIPFFIYETQQDVWAFSDALQQCRLQTTEQRYLAERRDFQVDDCREALRECSAEMKKLGEGEE